MSTAHAAHRADTHGGFAIGRRVLAGVAGGIAGGVVFGPLTLMPMMMGMPLFMVDATAMMSLMGHLIYGLILGLVAVGVLRKNR